MFSSENSPHSVRHFECVAHCAILSQCNIIRLYLIRSHFSPSIRCLFISINWNVNEERAKKKRGDASFYNSFNGVYIAKEFCHLEVTFFFSDDFFFLFYQFSFHFFVVLSIRILRCRLIEFYCMRLVTLSFKAIHFSNVVEFVRLSRFSLLVSASFLYFSIWCRNWFPIYPEVFSVVFTKLDSGENNCRRQSNILTSYNTLTNIKKKNVKRNGKGSRNNVDFSICHG